MECAHACDAVKLEFKRWGYSLYEKIKEPKMIEVMVYLFLTAVITITMRFHHGLSRSGLGEYMPWVVGGKYIQQAFNLPKWVDTSGLLAMLLSLILVFGIVYLTFGKIAKVLQTNLSNVLLSLGYAFAPLMIVGGLSHVLELFFIEYYHHIVNGFSQAFGLGVSVGPLAKRGEPWLLIFRVFPFIAGLWSLHILWNRVKMLHTPRKGYVFALASALPVFYLLLALHHHH